MGKSSIDDNIHIVCLQEGKTYTLEVLDDEIQAQLRLLKGGAEIIEEIGEGYEDGFIGFVRRLKESLQDGNLTSGDEGETNDDLEWVRGKSFNVRYIGLYAYSDSKGNELILYFAPKFVHARRGMDEDSVKERREQLLDRYDRVLLAIDRYQKDQARLDTSWIEKSDSCVGLLPLVVMLVRDYLEYGLYTVHYSELEHNGRGEINWERTINDEKPFIQTDRPIYTDYWTEQTLSDENNYFTRLHACLLSIWANKLADYGLAEVLNIAIPSLSEAELGEFGDEDYICSRIRGELGCQFVTHFRRTLQMIEALVTRTFDAEALDESAFSFGMGGVAALWEEAINKVLGSQLDCRICDCGGGDNHKTFRESIPYPIWQEVTNGTTGRKLKDSNTWRPDFVRVGADENSKPVFVILDAKYYSVVWNDRWLKGEPGIESISKQFFYKRVYQDLVKEHLDIEPGDIVNAFVFPALGEEQDIKKPEVYAKILWSDQQFSQKMFGGGDLHAVKLSGLRLLDSYASYDDDKEEWMKEIIRLCRNEKRADDGENGGTKGDEVKGDDTDDTSSKSSAVADQISEVPINNLKEDNHEIAVAPLVGAQGNMPQDGDGVVPPIAGDCISKEFIRDVMSIPSCSGREEMMKEYIKQFAAARGIDFKEDNHMDTVQKWQDSFIDRHERLDVLERVRDGHVELYTTAGGIGADDKLGCAIALALVDRLPFAKAAFFVEEETPPGMLGSRELDYKWFKDVSFCLSFDSPGWDYPGRTDRNRSSRTCAGALLYSDVFFKNILKPVCEKHGITNFADEPYTDVVQVRGKTPIMCYNVSNGGYKAHDETYEYLIVEDAQAAYKFGLDLLREIGENRYWFGDDDVDTSGGDGGRHS